jgi:predicted GIY-YIG superfamily endonuclease
MALQLEIQWNELKRHEIYRFWTVDGKRLYTGQQTTDGARIKKHLNGVSSKFKH